MNIGHVLIGVAILGMVLVLIRAFGLFAPREKPERLVGAEVRFDELEGLGPNPPEFPKAMVRGHVGDAYEVDFLEPVSIDGRISRGASITARHVGYPISRANHHKFDVRAVSGKLDTGQQFTALIRRA